MLATCLLRIVFFVVCCWRISITFRLFHNNSRHFGFLGIFLKSFLHIKKSWNFQLLICHTNNNLIYWSVYNWLVLILLLISKLKFKERLGFEVILYLILFLFKIQSKQWNWIGLANVVLSGYELKKHSSICSA